MPDVTEAPKKKRRKRHDQADQADFVAPVDGDWNNDVVLGKDPAKHYAYVDLESEDPGRLQAQGVFMTQTERGGRVRSPYDPHTEGPIKVGSLTLMECPTEMHEKAQKRSTNTFARRFGAEQQKIRDHIARTGGVGEHNKYTVERV